MKHIAYLILLTLVMVSSCGTDSHHFKLDGKLLHINQGEFYVYSPDGIINSMDTIQVQGGRFTYEIPCERKGILLIVFPNFSVQPVIAEAGKTVNVSGDVSHLKEIQVEGTKENELLSKFRKRIASASPPEILKDVEQFVHDNPKTDGARYLVIKYLLQTPMPKYSKAKQLVDLMKAQQPESTALTHLQRQLSGGMVLQGKSLPPFSTYDLKGNSITNLTLNSANVAVVNVWTSWSYPSMDIQRKLNDLKKHYGSKLKVIGISLDASKKTCKATLNNDSIRWSNICDEKMFGGSLIKPLGISSIPDNIILKNGRVVARGLDIDALTKKIKELI